MQLRCMHVPPHDAIHTNYKAAGEGDTGNRLPVSAQVASATRPSPSVQLVAILRIRAIAACTVGGANDVTDIEAQSCTDVAAIRLAMPSRGGGAEWEHGTGCLVGFVDARAVPGTRARRSRPGSTNSSAVDSCVLFLANNGLRGVHTTVNGVDAHSLTWHTCEEARAIE